MIVRLIVVNLIFLGSCLMLWPKNPYALLAITVGLGVLAAMGFYRDHKMRNQAINNLHSGLLNMQDNNLSFSLPDLKYKQYQPIVDLFNQVTEKLRKDRQYLHQRELLLDKVVNSSNIVVVLVDQQNRVIFYNQATLAFLSIDSSITGENWLDIQPDSLREYLQNKGSGICTIASKNQQAQMWFVSCSDLKLNGAKHQLYMLKPMTEELNKQELITWKKAIRVISHELNNSIAPISTMCHSGKLIAEKLAEPNLDRIFNSISGRIKHLNSFVKGYGDMARLKQPQMQPLDLIDLLNSVKQLYSFELQTDLQSLRLCADTAQLEQVFINLIKNAQEAAPNDRPKLVIDTDTDKVVVSIQDNGEGIAPEIIHNVLLPFYSTKAQGSGMGLAICREIIEAHSGSISLKNQPGGGLEVKIELPLSPLD